MAVLKKEYYTQKNGVQIIKVILTPTKKFPEGGYFYAPAEAEELVDDYNWSLNVRESRKYVSAITEDRFGLKGVSFHKELFIFYHNYNCKENIDHINMVEFDNTDNNLNVTTTQQNKFNSFTKNYSYNKYRSSFKSSYMLNGRSYSPFSVTHSEAEACQQANYIEQVILQEKLGGEYYMFDFKKYRRGSEDILDLERTGQISSEEATYRHILRYSTNAWYYLRFGLQDYFKENNIPVPEYSLDEQGFMIHPETGEKLCPFYK